MNAKPTDRQIRAALVQELHKARQATNDLRSSLLWIRSQILSFDRECSRAEYTDTGEAWELFGHIAGVVDACTRDLPPYQLKRGIRTADPQSKRVSGHPGAKSNQRRERTK